MVTIGQRYQYRNYESDKVRFVAEVVKIRSDRSHDVKVVQIFDWASAGVGHVYDSTNVASNSNWTLLEGQDNPEK